MAEESNPTIREWKRRYEHRIIQEDDSTLHQQMHQGDFATGLARLLGHPTTELRGRFARGRRRSDGGDPNEKGVAV